MQPACVTKCEKLFRSCGLGCMQLAKGNPIVAFRPVLAVHRCRNLATQWLSGHGFSMAASRRHDAGGGVCRRHLPVDPQQKPYQVNTVLDVLAPIIKLCVVL